MAGLFWDFFLFFSLLVLVIEHRVLTDAGTALVIRYVINPR